MTRPICQDCEEEPYGVIADLAEIPGEVHWWTDNGEALCDDHGLIRELAWRVRLGVDA